MDISSSQSLDHHFFQRISTTPHKGDILEAYKSVYARSTMVLFSRETKTPLAALTFKADDVGCLSMFTGRPSPKGATEPYFQGMLNMPDQAFTLTISNLTNEGWINFNILHTPHRVSAVDPGPAFGVNQVNELRKNESHTIEADQRTNCRMVLSGKTTIVKDKLSSEAKKVPLSVKQAETDGAKRSGLYFYLSVVADRDCKRLVETFAEGTVWKVVPGFVRRVAKPPVRELLPGFRSPFYETSGETGFLAPSARQRNADFPTFGLGPTATGLLSEMRSAPCPCRSAPHRSAPRRSAPRRSAPRSKHNAEASAQLVTPIDVGSTQAAELKYGQEVHVRSYRTGREYDYEHGSDSTVLCMSIWEDMKFLSLSSQQVEKELEEEVQEWVKNEGKALIESLNAIFKSDTCVIDLVSEADTIVCTCGHQCINHNNVGKLHRCPLCRSPVTAFVRADGIVV